MIRKLHKYGVRGKNLVWFTSYLTNRTQYMKLGNVESSLGTRVFFSRVKRAELCRPQTDTSTAEDQRHIIICLFYKFEISLKNIMAN